MGLKAAARTESEGMQPVLAATPHTYPLGSAAQVIALELMAYHNEALRLMRVKEKTACNLVY